MAFTDQSIDEGQRERKDNSQKAPNHEEIRVLDRETVQTHVAKKIGIKLETPIELEVAHIEQKLDSPSPGNVERALTLPIIQIGIDDNDFPYDQKVQIADSPYPNNVGRVVTLSLEKDIDFGCDTSQINHQN